MKIRKATKNNIKEITKRMRTEFAKPPFKDKVSLNAVLKSLNFYMKIGEIYIALIEKKIVGVIVFKKEQYWKGPVIIIEDLAVDEKFKKQGIGKALVNYVESCAKKRKIKLVCFSTHKKASAIKFYKKLGYKERTNIATFGKVLK